ncbi:MAG: type VI secretion system membrane subunit TssM, partial [Novosphingobium sp.]|nr:type VI secretion system membrane subunit TssM [Novosphingobium sp.]
TKFEAKAFGGGVDAVELTVGSTTYKFDPANMGEKPVIWSAQGNVPRASVMLYAAGAKVGEVSQQGPWALFRLMDLARKENAGPQAILATFGDGPKNVVFKVTLPTDANPFSRGGVWSFRCPVAL